MTLTCKDVPGPHRGFTPKGKIDDRPQRVRAVPGEDRCFRCGDPVDEDDSKVVEVAGVGRIGRACLACIEVAKTGVKSK